MKIKFEGKQGSVFIPVLDAEIEPNETVDIVSPGVAAALLDQADWVAADDESKAYVEAQHSGAVDVAKFAADLARWVADVETERVAAVEAAAPFHRVKAKTKTKPKTDSPVVTAEGVAP